MPATCSILRPSPMLLDYGEGYPAPDSLETFAQIAVQRIGAYAVNNLAPGLVGVTIDGNPRQNQTLTIGASSNLILESYNDTQLYMRDNSGLALFQTTYDVLGRNDTQILDIRSNVLPNSLMNASVIRSGASSNALWLHGDDTNKTTWISDMQVRTLNNTKIQLSTYCPNGFAINNMTEFNSNVIVDGDLHCLTTAEIDGNATVNGLLTVNNNAIVNGDLFTTTMNLWVDNPRADLNRVGYGFNINSRLELELVKYLRFSDDQTTLVKRVALFGNAPLTKDQKVDSIPYYKFDDLSATHRTYGGASNIFNGTGSNSYYPFFPYNPTSAGAWVVNDIGNTYTSVWVGIGTEEPTAELDVVGAIKATSVSATSIITQNFETTSDERLKDIIQNVDSEACLEKVSKLDVIDFKYISDTSSMSRVRSGLRAQQVREVMADAVIVRKFADLDDCHLIDTSVMLAYLVGAVKALAATRC